MWALDLILPMVSVEKPGGHCTTASFSMEAPKKNGIHLETEAMMKRVIGLAGKL